jgi:hypothetical protein
MEEKNKLFQHITKILIILGFSPRNTGFNLIRELLMTAYSTRNTKLNVLYPIVSEKFSQPVSAIQTAVRTSLKNAYYLTGFAFIEQLFGAKIYSEDSIPPPKEFVGVMFEYLTYFWDGQADVSIG